MCRNGVAEKEEGCGWRKARSVFSYSVKTVVVRLVLAGWLWERKQWGELDLLQLPKLSLIS